MMFPYFVVLPNHSQKSVADLLITTVPTERCAVAKNEFGRRGP